MTKKNYITLGDAMVNSIKEANTLKSLDDKVIANQTISIVMRQIADVLYADNFRFDYGRWYKYIEDKSK